MASRYEKPVNLAEALDLLGDGDWSVLAGGTDFYPAQGSRPLRRDVLDINGLDELRYIRDSDSHIEIGARTSWTDILASSLPPAFDALKQAAREVGSIQIQNAGTVAGNLCNASPAADGVPPLLVLDAELCLASRGGRRSVALGDFILGNRKTDLRRGELVTAVRIPKVSTGGRSHFLKLGARRYLVISIAMTAVRIVLDSGLIAEIAIAVGSCSAVAQRLRALEADLTGKSANAVRDVMTADHIATLTPIDDPRATAIYRRNAAREIVIRAILAGASPERIAA
ncbi:xanthine dehydrogenase family protein subunit M [soil metagenome]